jgi:hypothetical protein
MKGRFELPLVSRKAACSPAEFQRLAGRGSGGTVTHLTRLNYSSRGSQGKITPPFSYRDSIIERKQLAIIKGHSAQHVSGEHPRSHSVFQQTVLEIEEPQGHFRQRLHSSV